MNPIQVQHYGLHLSPKGVQFLHQHGPTGHNFIGWKEPSPFRLVFEKKTMCPHSINVNAGHPDQFHWATFMELYNDPFFQAFLPIPKEHGEPIPYLNDTHDGKWVTMAVILSRLASPVTPLVVPWGRHRNRELSTILKVTNVAPLILHGIQSSDQEALNELVLEANSVLPRKLILLGSPEVVVRYPMKRITSTLDSVHPHKLLSLPLESLGAAALKRYARGEQINAPYVKKEAA